MRGTSPEKGSIAETCREAAGWLGLRFAWRARSAACSLHVAAWRWRMRRDVARHRLALLPIHVDNRVAFMRWRLRTIVEQLRIAIDDRRESVAFWLATPRPRLLAPAVTLALTGAVLAALLIVPHAGRSAAPRAPHGRPTGAATLVTQSADVYATLQHASAPRDAHTGKVRAQTSRSVAPASRSSAAEPVADHASVVEHFRTKQKPSGTAPRASSPRVSKPAIPRPAEPRTTPPPTTPLPPNDPSQPADTPPRTPSGDRHGTDDSHSRDGGHSGKDGDD